MQLVEKFNEIKEAHGFKVREFNTYSFGDKDQCKSLLVESLKYVDPSMNLEWLPEYDEVIDWMTNTNGKGLMLSGDCGRGKTNIIMFALPFLFLHRLRKVIRPVHVDNLHIQIDQIIKRRIVSIDEIGAEPISSDYGTKYFPFMKLINAAEMNATTLLLSTNLNGDQIRVKYDERTLDRIVRLCRIIKFKGKSLRK